LELIWKEMDWFIFWHTKVKNNKISFDSKNWITVASLISKWFHQFKWIINVKNDLIKQLQEKIHQGEAIFRTRVAFTRRINSAELFKFQKTAQTFCNTLCNHDYWYKCNTKRTIRYVGWLFYRGNYAVMLRSIYTVRRLPR